jgi:hypothetical protein
MPEKGKISSELKTEMEQLLFWQRLREKCLIRKRGKIESCDILKQKNENRKDIFTQNDAYTDSKKETKERGKEG